MTKTLLHCPLEGYRQRYTELLADWEKRAFSEYFKVITVEAPEQNLTTAIRSGSVLDKVNRPNWAMGQISRLLTTHNMPYEQAVYLSDFFHPGLEALPYSGFKGKVFAYCWAQSFDQFDFTRPMCPWMRAWEAMALSYYTGVFVAHPLLKELICAVFPEVEHKIHVVGLPFDYKEVAKIANLASNFGEFSGVYSSRFDREKNPNLFLDLVEMRSDLKFCVCTGWSELTGTDTQAVQRAIKLEAANKLTIFKGLQKSDYYTVLLNCRVQINTAFQDWVSFTLLEGLTMGCQPLYPDYRSFPSTLNYSKEFLYIPENLTDLNNKLDMILGLNLEFPHRSAVLNQHGGTLSLIAQIIDDH